MTDEHQPDRDLPVAGRKPGPEPIGDATVPLKRPAGSGPLADDEPTVVTPRAGDGPTVPLKRPHDPGPRADDAAERVDDATVRPGETGPRADDATARPGDAGPRADDAAVRADAAVRPPDAGLPVDDEPTLVSGPAGDDVTTRLKVPADAAAPAGGTAEVAVDDQPTVERPELTGRTQRLRPPAVVPGALEPGDGPAAPDGEASTEDGRDAALSPDLVMSGGGAAPVSGGESPSVPPIETARTGDGPAADHPASPPRRRLSSAGTLIWVLLALFGFTLVVQLRSNDADDGLATARQEDLVRILSDLEARDTRLQAEIAALETSQRQLTSGVAGREAALAEADKRAAELGLLAGTLPGRGPGLRISLEGVKASAILNAVQELRGAGGEVMQLNGPTGGAVRIVASTYFVDAQGGGIVADGAELTGPYTLWVIGPPQTMQTALQIPGGVVASVHSDGGSVTMDQRPMVEVTAVREPGSLQYARPVS